MPTSTRRVATLISSPPGARKTTSASSGTIARSSKSRIDTIRWPFGVAMSPRSSRICMTIAVEVMHEAGAGHERLHRRKPGSDADAGEQQGADADLQRAQPEDLAPQAQQPRGLHLQADDEQEHDHAEFGDVQDRLGIGEDAQAERADDESGREIAEDGAEADPPKIGTATTPAVSSATTWTSSLAEASAAMHSSRVESRRASAAAGERAPKIGACGAARPARKAELGLADRDVRRALSLGATAPTVVGVDPLQAHADHRHHRLVDAHRDGDRHRVRRRAGGPA